VPIHNKTALRKCIAVKQGKKQKEKEKAKK
jgi:hypothetical protein